MTEVNGISTGITSDLRFLDWRPDVQGNASDARTNGAVTMMNRENKEMARWDLTDRRPSKLSGPGLKADGHAFGAEEPAIVHEGIVCVRRLMTGHAA